MVLVLIETAAGYALFRVQKKGLLNADAQSIFEHFSTLDETKKNVALHAFSKFKGTKEAMEDATALIESRMGKSLKKLLKKNIVKLGLTDPLIVSDKLLGSVIKKKLNLDIVYSDSAREIMRGIREQLSGLIAGLSEQDNKIMALSLSHSLNRFKLKFSTDKVDTMIIQAVGLLDDLDKELNNFAMRLKEWYGWHFPELSKIVADNIIYAKLVKHIGMRTNTQHCESLSDFVPEDIEKEIRQAAEISMGIDITAEDMENIHVLCDRVIELAQYRLSLAEYLKFRMEAIAPNLTYIVGEIIGARLISHAGSLVNLAKHPASTVQILGAEKALFRALKTKQSTPKYGLIYHAQVVGQSAPKLKGKASRILAAKLALCCRVDALGDQLEATVGIESKRYIDRRLEELQDNTLKNAVRSFDRPSLQKYIPERQMETYDPNVDIVKKRVSLAQDASGDNEKKKHRKH